MEYRATKPVVKFCIKGVLREFYSPLIMGILNVTPDSFFDGGSFFSVEKAVKQAVSLKENGADIIDIGAYSSRPNATHISELEEFNRLSPVLVAVRKALPDVIISIDTFRANIAKEAVNLGADMINDISAGELDSAMFETIAKLNVPYIMMHTKGTPQNMQQNADYEDLIGEITNYFAEKIYRLRLLGANNLIIDPGFGFAKNVEHNYLLLNKLHHFQIFELPVLVGVSRKSMIYKYLNITPQDALNATTVLHTIALQKGAQILRVHDVKEAKETILILKKLQETI